MYNVALMNGIYVGPATVTAVGNGSVVLALPDREAEAEMALAFPYKPCRGDIVLVFGEEDLYVIGVLQAKGITRFDLPGDVEIKAGGTLRLSACETVEVKSPRIRLRTDCLETFARSVFERVVDAYRWCEGTLQTSAGRMRTVVSGTSSLNAERIVELAKKDVRIDGKRINLG